MAPSTAAVIAPRTIEEPLGIDHVSLANVALEARVGLDAPKRVFLWTEGTNRPSTVARATPSAGAAGELLRLDRAEAFRTALGVAKVVVATRI